MPHQPHEIWFHPNTSDGGWSWGINHADGHTLVDDQHGDHWDDALTGITQWCSQEHDHLVATRSLIKGLRSNPAGLSEERCNGQDSRF